MVALADGYFDTLQLNDGTVHIMVRKAWPLRPETPTGTTRSHTGELVGVRSHDFR